PEIRAVLARGRRVRTESLDVFVLPTARPRPRLGFVVPKARHTVVERNRLKRRLKEIGRIRVLGALFDVCPSVDVLVRARPAAYRASWDELNAQFLGVVEGLCSQS
ncbi:MAG: ribonuclease P protein component, partial [Gemmatimonadetes bacterium]|nr:ribonuclease P protein component [Gemmatimonadota bacterium]